MFCQVRCAGPYITFTIGGGGGGGGGGGISLAEVGMLCRFLIYNYLLYICVSTLFSYIATSPTPTPRPTGIYVQLTGTVLVSLVSRPSIQ